VLLFNTWNEAPTDVPPCEAPYSGEQAHQAVALTTFKEAEIQAVGYADRTTSELPSEASEEVRLKASSVPTEWLARRTALAHATYRATLCSAPLSRKSHH
jgi:hypothetical protein